MSALIDSISAFEKLLNIEYVFILGRKNKTVELHIYFDKKHFYHLAGLQHLKDIANINQDRETVFNLIKSRKIKPELICSSIYFNNISDRIECLKYIEQVFDSNKTIFKYNSSLHVFSLIQADYLLKNTMLNKTLFTFLTKDKNGNYFCKSFFPQQDKDYSEKQMLWTVLLKKKINKETSEEQILFKHIKYVE